MREFRTTIYFGGERIEIEVNVKSDATPIEVDMAIHKEVMEYFETHMETMSVEMVKCQWCGETVTKDEIGANDECKYCDF